MIVSTTESLILLNVHYNSIVNCGSAWKKKDTHFMLSTTPSTFNTDT